MKKIVFLSLLAAFAFKVSCQEKKRHTVILPDAGLAVQCSQRVFLTECSMADIINFYKQSAFKYASDSSICLSYSESAPDSCIIVKVSNHVNFRNVSYEWQFNKPKLVKLLDEETGSYESEAEYPGGITNFYEYLNQAFSMPSQFRDKKVYGKAVFKIVVDGKGNVSQVAIDQGFEGEIDKRLVKLLKNSRRWNPKIKNGKVVKAEIILPITIFQE